MSDGLTTADHVFVRTSDAPDGSSFECLDGCGRHVVVRHEPPEMIVLGKGDAGALHRWTDLGVSFTTSVRQD